MGSLKINFFSSTNVPHVDVSVMVIAPVSPSLNTRKWLPDTRFRSVCKASRPTLWSGCDSAREVCSSSLSSARMISSAPQMLPSEAITHFPAALLGAERVR